MDTNFRPPPAAFLDLSGISQQGDRRARCSRIAVCDASGLPARVFNQGQPAHFFYEFEILDDIDVPSGGLEFHDAAGHVIHGKSSLQYGTPAPMVAKRGTRLFYHHVITLEVAVGEYWFTIGLASSEESAYIGYQRSALSYQELEPLMREHCRVVNASSFRVRYAPSGSLLPHGIANLPGACRLMAFEAPQVVLPPPLSATPTEIDDSSPTIFHVTHWKAGSQW